MALKDNKRLQFIMDMVDKVSAPAAKVNKSLQAMGKDVTATQAKLKNLNKQAADLKAFKAMQEQMGKNNARTKELGDKVGQLKVQMAMVEKPTKAMRAALRDAEREQKAHVKTVHSHNTEMGKLEAALKKAKIPLDNIERTEKNLTAAILRTNGALKNQQSELDKTAKHQERLTKAQERHDKASAAAAKMAGTGAGLMAGGGAVMAATAAYANPFRQFDKGMSAVQATGRMTDADKADLSRKVDQLATDSVFNHVEAAGAAGFLAQAGMNKEAIELALGPVMSLAAATGSDLMRTADISSNIMSGFQLENDQMGRVADVLTMAANSFNVDLSMLGETMKYLAPVASKLGVGMEEATAMAGLLGNVGIQGSQAGNALKSMAGSLAAPNKKKDDILDGLGIRTKDRNGNLRSMPELLLELQGKTKGMGNADMTAMFKTLFGEEFYGPAMEIVSKGGDVLNKAVSDMYAAQGAAKEAEAKRLNNLDGDLVKLGNQFSATQVKFGQAMDPIYRRLAQMAVMIGEKLNKWMQDNPKIVMMIGVLATILGAVAAAMGAILLVLSPVLLAYGKMWLIQKALIILSNTWIATKLKLAAAFALNAIRIAAFNVALYACPLMWIVAGIAAVVAAVVLLYKNWDSVTKFFGQAWESIKGFFGDGWSYILNLFSMSPMDALQTFGGDVISFFQNLVGFVGRMWEKFINFIPESIGKASNWVKGLFGDNADGLKVQMDAADKATQWHGDDVPMGDIGSVGPKLVQGNQIQAAPQTTVVQAPATFHVTIDASNMNTDQLKKVFSDLQAEADRKARQQERARNKD